MKALNLRVCAFATDMLVQSSIPVKLNILFQATCLWRRALLACSEMNRVLTPKFAKRLGMLTNWPQYD